MSNREPVDVCLSVVIWECSWILEATAALPHTPPPAPGPAVLRTGLWALLAPAWQWGSAWGRSRARVVYTNGMRILTDPGFLGKEVTAVFLFHETCQLISALNGKDGEVERRCTSTLINILNVVKRHVTARPSKCITETVLFPT